MAFSGKLTAANHADLFGQSDELHHGQSFRRRLVGRDWTVARQDSLTWGPATWSSGIPGPSGSEEVYVGLCAATYTDGVKGGLVCKVVNKAYRQRPRADGEYGFSGYGATATERDRPGRTCSSGLAGTPPLNVWIRSNKARVDARGGVQRGLRQRLPRAAPAFSAAEREPVAFGLPDGRVHEACGNTRHGTTPSRARARATPILHRRNLAFVRRGSFPFGNNLFLLSRLSSDLQAGRRMDLALRHLPHDQPAELVERL